MLANPKWPRLLPTAFGSRLRLLNELAKIFYDEEVRAELRKVTGPMLNLYERRNRLAHGDWVMVNRFDGKGARLYSRAYNQGVEVGLQTVTPAQIRALRAATETIARELGIFFARHSPDGSPARRVLGFFRRLEKRSERGRHKPV